MNELNQLGILRDALHALGSMLAAEGAEEHLIVVGGVAMNLRGFAARATTDVDVIARSEAPSAGRADISPPEPLPEPLASAVRRVARDFGLDEDWLNTDVAKQWHPGAGMPPGLTDDIEWHHFGALHLGVPGRQAMIMLKLFATADRGPRSVHAQDLLRLHPTDDELDRAREWVATQDAGRDSMRASMSSPNMSADSVTVLAERAREAALHAVWAQWGVLNPRLLGPSGAGGRGSVVDPEALVLASLALWDDERRLADVLAWWAEHGAPLLSVRRLDSLGRAFPAGVGASVQVFARWARDAGDTRWKPKAAAEPGEEPPVRSGKGPATLALVGAEALLLKLRAGFGVGAKPDVLCYLLALDGEGASSKEIARAVGYAEKNVRLAARELALGGFIEERDGFPTQYAARPGFARSLVHLLSGRPGEEAAPRWTHWWAVYAFLLHVASWGEEETLAQPYLLSSRARELFNEYRWAFPPRELQLPEPSHYPGERYLPAFAETLDAISGWIGSPG